MEEFVRVYRRKYPVDVVKVTPYSFYCKEYDKKGNVTKEYWVMKSWFSGVGKRRSGNE